LAAKEAVYGFGLQFLSFMQRGTKKTLRTNADPKSDTGDTHAPVPFYVTTNGYGVLVDTAQYPTFYCGNLAQKGKKKPSRAENGTAVLDGLSAAYRSAGMLKTSEVVVEIPRAKGVDVYVFAGPTMRNAVQRYNLFSGGGALPTRWGLGVCYRTKTEYTQQEVLNLAAEFRAHGIPCDIIGLEPGWQSHAYPCTFVWSKAFPDPESMLEQLTNDHFRLNLWEHAFVHPDSPIHAPLIPYSGDYTVWQGLVPDFLNPKANQIFADFHEKEHVALGVSGYKMDECDNSDFTGGWSFPEVSRFPSGVDGEQMHSLFPMRYLDCLQGIFERRKQRTYGLVRSAHALAAPYPYVLYSDLYDHRQYVRALVNSGFSGLLWSPEVRDAGSVEELVRRLQTTIFSAMALINAWYIRNPPWKQVKMEENNKGQLDPDWERTEATCREVLELRMRFIPYLQAAFVRYHREGIPPFRALVMDFPTDLKTWEVDDQFLVGSDLMVAPVFAGDEKRTVYLPEGVWFDFWTEKRYTGKQSISIEVPLDQIPIFVKTGSLVPLAQPTLHTDAPNCWVIEARLYGGGPASTTLYEDDDSYDPKLESVTLNWNGDGAQGSVSNSRGQKPERYQINRWRLVPA
jgi:alpha-D-xyloside xylohydrolase